MTVGQSLGLAASVTSLFSLLVVILFLIVTVMCTCDTEWVANFPVQSTVVTFHYHPPHQVVSYLDKWSTHLCTSSFPFFSLVQLTLRQNVSSLVLESPLSKMSNTLGCQKYLDMFLHRKIHHNSYEIYSVMFTFKPGSRSCINCSLYQINQVFCLVIYSCFYLPDLRDKMTFTQSHWQGESLCGRTGYYYLF